MFSTAASFADISAAHHSRSQNWYGAICVSHLWMLYCLAKKHLRQQIAHSHCCKIAELKQEKKELTDQEHQGCCTTILQLSNNRSRPPKDCANHLLSATSPCVTQWPCLGCKPADIKMFCSLSLAILNLSRGL